MKRNLPALLLVGVLVLPVAARGQGAGDAAKDAARGAADFLSRLDPEEQKREAFRIFDDLYYVGIGWVAAYLLTTRDGLILIDTTYGEYADHVLAGIRGLGFDPGDIEFILVTHAHFDHAGGVKTIQSASGARVGMTEADWEMLESGEATARFPFDTVPRDRVIRDGDTLVLGEARLEFAVTPGHTPGVLSIAFTVHDGGAPHRAFTFGGAGLNFSGVERTEMYLESVKRLLEMEGVEVNVPNHAMMGRVFERAAALEGRGLGDPHPFVAPGEYRAWLEELLAKAREKLVAERVDASR